jgi:hypothetical protein
MKSYTLHDLLHMTMTGEEKFCLLSDVEDLKWELRDAEGAIAAHNGECESLCGVGELEGVRCGYRPYFPRHCSDCPRNWIIERSPPQPTAEPKP